MVRGLVLLFLFYLQLYLQWPTNRKSHYGLWNGAIFNDLQRPLTWFSTSRHSLSLNISQTVTYPGWKKPRFFGKFFRFLGFLGFLRFFRFLGFNVHNAEHRYMTRDNSLHENICLLIHYLLQCAKLPNLKVIDG